jgi:hypothetical protein
MPKLGRNKMGNALIEALKKEAERAPKPKAGDLAANFIKILGGMKHFAKVMADEFLLADAGSLMRQRMLSMVFQSLKHVEEEYSLDTLENMDEIDLLQIVDYDTAVVVAYGSQGGQDDSADEERGPEGEQGGQQARVVEEAPGEARQEGPRLTGCPEGLFTDPEESNEDGSAEGAEEETD